MQTVIINLREILNIAEHCALSVTAKLPVIIDLIKGLLIELVLFIFSCAMQCFLVCYKNCISVCIG